MPCCRRGAESPAAQPQAPPSSMEVVSGVSLPRLLASEASIESSKDLAPQDLQNVKVLAETAPQRGLAPQDLQEVEVPAETAPEPPPTAGSGEAGSMAWLQALSCYGCWHVSSSELAIEEAASPQQLPEAQEEEPVPTAVADASEPTASRPNFTGTWVLQRTGGDMDRFMADMGANWIFRKLGGVLKYGVGRVTIGMVQDGDRIEVKKVMADPTKSNAQMELTVGQGWTDWMDEFGPCQVHTRWQDHNVLIWDSRLVPSGVASSMKMYYEETGTGELIEEYIAPSGVAIKYYFQKRSPAKLQSGVGSFFAEN